MLYMKRRIEEMTASFVAGYRCTGTVDWHEELKPYYPPTVNDPGAAAFAMDVAKELLGESKVGRGG
jgi:IAA-amino acid hydrolase